MALGVSGGLVPCPDAIAILLVAVAINRILLGLTLIVSFSLGLAVVLIVIGLLMVNGRRLLDRVGAFERFTSTMPIVSALVVLGLGAVLTVGAYSRVRDEFSLAGTGTAFAAKGETQVIYLAGGQNQVKQLFIASINNSNPILLSDGRDNVVNFALSPDQRQIVYMTQTESLENKIWLVDLQSGERKQLADCSEALCSRPVWSPDGTRIVYEYTHLAGENSSGLTTLWWIDVTTDDAKPVFQEAQLPGSNPRWAPNGKWLSYATPENLQLHNLETGESHTIKSALPQAVDWSPDSRKVLYKDVTLRDGQFITQLLIYDLASQTVTNMDADGGYENLLAAWSPDGKWIAAVRRDLSTPRGDQIWLLRVDGNEVRMLTDTPNVLHGNLTWSRDGNHVLYDLYQLDLPTLESNIQIIEVESGTITELGIKGYNPEWRLP
jgi:Tol biopolymer transport system component